MPALKIFCHSTAVLYVCLKLSQADFGGAGASPHFDFDAEVVMQQSCSDTHALSFCK